jgi:radical SAM protein with 4Fe4S-binding SPASM domain
MFPEGFLEWFRQAGGRPMLGCSPILDILPHGEVISCYPLLNWRREALPESEGADRLRDRLHARFRATRQAGIGPACTDCDFRGRGECAGGCMAASMRRLRRAGGQTLEHKATGLVSMALPDASNIGAGSYP